MQTLEHNRIVTTRYRSAEDIFKDEVYRALTDPKCIKQFQRRVARKINRELRKERLKEAELKAYHEQFHNDFIKPCIIDRATGNDL